MKKSSGLILISILILEFSMFSQITAFQNSNLNANLTTNSAIWEETDEIRIIMRSTADWVE